MKKTNIPPFAVNKNLQRQRKKSAKIKATKIKAVKTKPIKIKQRTFFDQKYTHMLLPAHVRTYVRIGIILMGALFIFAGWALVQEGLFERPIYKLERLK